MNELVAHVAKRRRLTLALAGATVLAVAALMLVGALRGSAASGDPAVAAVQAAAAERQADRASFRTIDGAVEFPAGVSYSEALRAILVGELTGRSEVSMRLVGGLPGDAVAAVPSDRQGRVVIDLSAPYGYDTVNGPLGATYMFPEGRLPTGERSTAGPWPLGASLAVPVLPDCMRTDSPARAPVRTCTADDVPAIDPDRQAFIPLP